MSQSTLNQKQEAFIHKVLGDASATMTTVLACMGDRLGLFKDLAANGPATSDQLAQRRHTNERYVREWLGGMATAGYLEYDTATSRFTLPAAHVAALAAEGGPFFFGGLGTMGFHEKKVQELCVEAGFRTIRRVPLENPFNNLYEICL